MRCDDDSFLSAYMDGQLNGDQRQLVESMLVARPQFADKLRDLAAVRDIVVGLNREASVDVTDDVMERIRRRTRPRLPLTKFHPWSPRTRRLAASAGMFAAVAGLVLVVNLSSLEHKPIGGASDEVGRLVDNRITDSEQMPRRIARPAGRDRGTGHVPSTYAFKLNEADSRVTPQSAASPAKRAAIEEDRFGLPADLAVARAVARQSQQTSVFRRQERTRRECRTASRQRRRTHHEFQVLQDYSFAGNRYRPPPS